MARVKKKVGEFCGWDEAGAWETSCGNAFQFNDDVPRENGFLFCPVLRTTHQGAAV